MVQEKVGKGKWTLLGSKRSHGHLTIGLIDRIAIVVAIDVVDVVVVVAAGVV